MLCFSFSPGILSMLLFLLGPCLKYNKGMILLKAFSFCFIPDVQLFPELSKGLGWAQAPVGPGLLPQHHREQQKGPSLSVHLSDLSRDPMHTCAPLFYSLWTSWGMAS